MFRFVNPASELRIAGGRELHLRSLQPLGLYPANSIFVGDYLTTRGQLPEEDYRMIEDLGFSITRGEETAIAADSAPPRVPSPPSAGKSAAPPISSPPSAGERVG